MNEALLIFPEFMTHDILRAPPSPPSHPSPASEGRRNPPPLRAQRAGEGRGGGGSSMRATETTEFNGDLQ